MPFPNGLASASSVSEELSFCCPLPKQDELRFRPSGPRTEREESRLGCRVPDRQSSVDGSDWESESDRALQPWASLSVSRGTHT